MPKVVHCRKINPRLKCNYVIRGDTVEEVLQKAGIHALVHGLLLSPDLLKKIEDAIEDE